MVDEARRLAPHLEWVLADLATLSLGRTFDVVVLAGNVPLFCPPQDRRSLVARCAAHVGRSGRLVAGFQTDRDYALADYDQACERAGLVLIERWSTWAKAPFDDGAYAVSVHAAHDVADSAGVSRR